MFFNKIYFIFILNCYYLFILYMEKDIDIMMELLKDKKIKEAKNIEKEIYNKYKKEDNEELYIKYKEYFEFFKFECDRLEILEKVDNIITLI